MRLSLSTDDPFRASADAVVSGHFEPVRPGAPLPRGLSTEDRASAGGVAAAWARGEMRGRRKESTIIHLPQGPSRLLLAGLGSESGYSAEIARRAAAESIRALAGRGVRRAIFRAETFAQRGVPLEAAVRAIVDGVVLGSYTFSRFKSKAPEVPVDEVVVAVGRGEASRVRAAFREESRLVGVVTWTRDVANLPASEAPPERLAEEARALAKSHQLGVQVFDEKALAKMGCGGLLAVGGGSSRPPRLIVLEYPGRGRSPPTIALVGKGITFDSGGISIKPAASMSYMKFDKSGAVAVLGTLRACRDLGVRPRVIGLMACAENVPSGTSYRPGDLVRTYNGRTIEVLNTDAEGRVVLADALAYAAKNYAPEALIDIATLTGAATVALGDTIAGLISTDEPLARRIERASALTGEAVWRMPLTDYHRELVRAADYGDVRNSIEIPLAGMLTASAFLETFVGETRWAHLDIAGPAYTTLTTRRYQPAYLNVGAVAFGVRLLSRFLLDYGAR